MTRLLPFAALLVCTITAGCGGADTDRPSPPAPRLSDAEQAGATVRRQMQAVARGDGATACGLFSARALREVQDQISRRAGDIGCVSAVEQGAGGLPEEVRAALRHPEITRIAVRGDKASATVRLPAGLADRRSARLSLRRTRGGWRTDGLPPL